MSVSTTFPATFDELIQLILQGQSERVKSRLAFLTSTQPLRSLVSVSTTFPATFDELIQLILQGQSERVKSRLAFLTSTQPLRSLV